LFQEYPSIILFVVAGCACQESNDGGVFLKQVLPGKWKEDQYKRKNLNNYLYEMGLIVFERIYVTSTSWENKMTIGLKDNGNVFDVSGTKGPYATKYNFILNTDGRTRSDVDLGQLGGKTDATAEIKGNTMITYLRKKGKRNVFMTAKRTINPTNPNELIYETKHLKSGVALTSFMYRQN
jgi:hypothetical protein